MVLRSFDSTGEASVQLEENYASTTRDAVVTRWLYMGESESDTVLRNLGLNSEKMDFLVTKSKKRTAVPQSGSAVKERRQLLGRSCFWTERWCGPSGKSTWGSPRQGGSSPPAHYNMSPKHTHTRTHTHFQNQNDLHISERPLWSQADFRTGLFRSPTGQTSLSMPIHGRIYIVSFLTKGRIKTRACAKTVCVK